MFLLIPLIFSREYVCDSKGYYSFKPKKDDLLTFTLQNDERAFIFSSMYLNECFSFPVMINKSSISIDLRAISFDNSDFQIKVTKEVNLSIWVIDKLFCHPNSIFVMASYEYSLDIKPKKEFINENPFNYCIFSPSHLKEYRKVSFDQKKSENSSNFSKCDIYSTNVLTPDYKTEGQYIEGVLSYSFFLKISVPANTVSSEYATIKMSFIDENSDYSFIRSSSNSFFSTVYYCQDDHFIVDDDWIDDVKFSYSNRQIKKFHWIWIVAILFIMIILLLLSLFIIYTVLRKRNGSSMNSSREDEDEECIPDAQSINQFPGESNDENDAEYQQNDNIKKAKKKKEKNISNDDDKNKENFDDNPYCISNLIDDVNGADISESIDSNVIEINPYSLPKA